MRKPHYAWVVLGVTFLVLLASAAMRATPSVLIVPLEKEFGWSRTTISFAVSVGLLLYGLIGPFAAGFINRYGPRRMMMASTLLIGFGALSTIWVKQPWQLVALWGVLVGCGTGVIAIVLGATVVQRWFATNRGLALGMLTASAATGQLVFLPLLARIVEASGWRAAVITMAVAAVCLTPVVMIWMRDRPEEKGLRAFGDAAAATAAAASMPVTAPVARTPVANPFVAAISALAMASRSRVFWIL